MAIKFVSAPVKQWSLISSDERPSSDIPEGSTLHYIDTGEQYIFHNGAWEPDMRLQYAIARAMGV